MAAIYRSRPDGGEPALMNEKLLDLSYYIGFVQSILKILAPIAVLTLLMGTFKFFSTWSFSWILSLVMPVVMMLSRGIANAVLFHTNKLTDTGRVLESEPGFMALGVNFDAASRIIEDSSRMMNVILNIELGIRGALICLIPGCGWLAGNVANRLTAKLADGLIGTVARAGTPGAVSGIIRGTIRGGKATPSAVAAAPQAIATAARVGASYAARTVTFVQAPPPPRPSGPKPTPKTMPTPTGD